VPTIREPLPPCDTREAGPRDERLKPDTIPGLRDRASQVTADWNAGKGELTEAKDLKPGTKLRSPDGETTETVTAVKVWTGLKWMHDLLVPAPL